MHRSRGGLAQHESISFQHDVDTNNLLGNRKGTLICWLVVLTALLLFWLPVLLAARPGLFTYDAGDVSCGAWRQVLSGQLNDHKSVMFTLLIGPVLSLGAAYGDFNIGVSLFAVFQSLLLAALFAWLVIWMAKRGAPRWLLVGSIAFFALNPLVSIYAITDCEDTLFAGAVLLFMILLYRLLTENNPTARMHVLLAFSGFCFLHYGQMDPLDCCWSRRSALCASESL